MFRLRLNRQVMSRIIPERSRYFSQNSVQNQTLTSFKKSYIYKNWLSFEKSAIKNRAIVGGICGMGVTSLTGMFILPTFMLIDDYTTPVLFSLGCGFYTIVMFIGYPFMVPLTIYLLH